MKHNQPLIGFLFGFALGGGGGLPNPRQLGIRAARLSFLRSI
jgi:hypothetical protein